MNNIMKRLTDEQINVCRHFLIPESQRLLSMAKTAESYPRDFADDFAVRSRVEAESLRALCAILEEELSRRKTGEAA